MGDAYRPELGSASAPETHSGLRPEGAISIAGHTHGPWRIEPKDGREGARGYWLHDDDGEYVAMVCRQGIEAEELPNAKLIAAAPELLECANLLDGLCAWLLHRYGPDSPSGKEASFRQTRVREVLTKAQGEK